MSAMKQRLAEAEKTAARQRSRMASLGEALSRCVRERRFPFVIVAGCLGRDSPTGAGDDHGIDHNKNWLRFPDDSTFLRSHYLHSHPYATPSLECEECGGDGAGGADRCESAQAAEKVMLRGESSRVEEMLVRVDQATKTEHQMEAKVRVRAPFDRATPACHHRMHATSIET
jgi:hypothetical protein